MNNFEVTVVTYGKYEYYLDEFQRAVCANGDTKDMALEIFFENLNPGYLENTDMTGFSWVKDYIIIYIQGNFCININAESKEEAEEKAIEIWGEADFGNLDNLDILEVTIK